MLVPVLRRELLPLVRLVVPRPVERDDVEREDVEREDVEPEELEREEVDRDEPARLAVERDELARRVLDFAPDAALASSFCACSNSR